MHAFATGMLSSLGHNPTIAIRNFTGEADFDAAAPEKASVRIEIKADSLEVTDDVKSKDRREIESMMNDKVLESNRYPIIVLQASAPSINPLGDSRFQIKLNGTLELRGVTRAVPIATKVGLMGDMMSASGEFSLLQSNFGIPPISVAGGASKLKDELKFAFDVVARKQG